MAFSGYLIKFTANNGTVTELPITYMRYETYKITPNQRMDLDPTRDTTGLLHRNALQHTASKVEFQVPRMDNGRMETLMSLIRSNWLNPLARDVNMTYYDPETNGYKTGHFYMPDIAFTIRNIDATHNIINYEETRLAFIEY